MGEGVIELMSTLTESLDSALQSVPESTVIVPPKDGISLFDIKNDLLLSYLQNLVFLIIIKLREGIDSPARDGDDPASPSIAEQVVTKLVELRVYLEKGVRPLEGRLKYQIDKVVKAADDAARNAAHRPNNGRKSVNGISAPDEGQSGSEDESSSDTDGEPAKTTAEIDELSYRPNPSALMRPGRPSQPGDVMKKADGVYRPPRITPTALPTTSAREERAARKPLKSATLDEFVSTELSTAPLAEPSIGSTIVSGGRRSKSQKERAEEAEREAYEESNFVRLPKESRKDRAKKGGRGREGGYGGEEWRGLGEGVARIERLTQRKKGGNGVLEKSRKRATEDGPRGSGELDGGRFDKRRKLHGSGPRK